MPETVKSCCFMNRDARLAGTQTVLCLYQRPGVRIWSISSEREQLMASRPVLSF